MTQVVLETRIFAVRCLDGAEFMTAGILHVDGRQAAGHHVMQSCENRGFGHVAARNSRKFTTM
jgi:hypothetical protein